MSETKPYLESVKKERLSPMELEYQVSVKYRRLGIPKTQKEIQEEVVELMKLQK